jgi:hypothetical protein
MSVDSRSSPALTHNANYSIAASLFLFAAAIVAAFAGSILGALVTLAMWRATRPTTASVWLLSALGTASAFVLSALLVVAWPWRLLLSVAGYTSTAPAAPAIFRSVLVEMTLGPLLIALLSLAIRYWRSTIQGQESTRARDMAKRKRALERGWQGPADGRALAALSDAGAGLFEFGAIAESRRPFDLSVDELQQHVFIPGASGSGKTTTIGTLADGALTNGYGVVIVDCKGSGLGGTARSLAQRHQLPLTTVDPRDPDSLGYDPCSGDAAAVANKLVGAFTFSGEAEIYKQVAMEVVPVVCRAMTAAGQEVSLHAIYEALNKGGLSRLGRQPGAEPYKERLTELEDSGGVGAAGYVGFQRRLGALMEGTFGELFRKQPALSWHEQLASPRVTYLSLSATAAGEDVELFGRVVTQDLKQVCDDRMRTRDRGEEVTPVLIVYDEFAALREARQIVDLLLQARQARAPIVVATQYIPEEVAIRKPVLSAGLLVVHRLEADDAELLAAQFGTHTTSILTSQVDYTTGHSEKGSVRWGDEYDVHPNTIRELPNGMAAVLSRSTRRKEIVQIKRPA